MFVAKLVQLSDTQRHEMDIKPTGYLKYSRPVNQCIQPQVLMLRAQLKSWWSGLMNLLIPLLWVGKKFRYSFLWIYGAVLHRVSLASIPPSQAGDWKYECEMMTSLGHPVQTHGTYSVGIDNPWQNVHCVDMPQSKGGGWVYLTLPVQTVLEVSCFSESI